MVLVDGIVSFSLLLRALAVFALSEGEQEERRQDSAQHTGSKPVFGKIV
jgi:hypothetical protein